MSSSSNPSWQQVGNNAVNAFKSVGSEGISAWMTVSLFEFKVFMVLFLLGGLFLFFTVIFDKKKHQNSVDPSQ